MQNFIKIYDVFQEFISIFTSNGQTDRLTLCRMVLPTKARAIFKFSMETLCNSLESFRAQERYKNKLYVLNIKDCS